MTANREFSGLIQGVEHGRDFLITRRVKPVAKLVPHHADKIADPERDAAWRRPQGCAERAL